jgi:dipeptidase E
MHIVAMGGGGFYSDSENPLLESYVVNLAKKSKPKACFIPTASAENEEYIAKFYKTFEHLSCQSSHLSMFGRVNAKLDQLLLEQDIIYVGGGNTKSMLALWREWGVDRILRQAWEKGIVLAGTSAGSICWFEEGITDSYADKLRALKCLGFLKGSNCPHYDGEAERRPSYQQLLSEGGIDEGYATEDSVGLHFVGTKLHQVISARPKSKAYRLTLSNGKAVETALDPLVLV